MRCPRCEVETEVIHHERVDVHSCPKCGGTFLDRGDLNRVAEPTPGDLEYSTLDHDSFEHADVFGPTDCPRCGHTPMKKVEFNVHTGIILDYCDRCGGFWLDGRELDRINDEVRRLNEQTDDVPDPPMLWFARFIWTLPR